MDVQDLELQVPAGCEALRDHFAWLAVECAFVDLYAGQAFADAVIARSRDREGTLRFPTLRCLFTHPP